ncbi:lytic transglycosylase domain-containing protein [Parabacteroides sp. 52]|uniref:lytic transglycosylase domain-containing protein n=1 Tax=unclassified Parabacteroides TaxID=2649774 RepID=UPI0013D12DC1|nr:MULTISPECIES: lytic transglycosylase domain-containing protein [unclassified Parabacteroides]MDH6535289.1 membrane-bound lytic murein transglycosylase D [Parabacteroides sp. PM5-20]NDV55852.1 lytic transglycosylase domain-containing protein [Parabacteroides sp. 52]
MRFYNYIFSFLVGVVFCVSIFLLLGSRDTEQVREERPVVSAMTVTPEVPTTVVFCGKTIDLTRYNMHEGLDRELSSFTYFHSTTLLLFKRANRYFPLIEPILKEYGIPDDFKYLAVIESHLDPRVSSPARAVGTWQFLEATGKQYGLTITPTVDERCDVYKSTVAACKYLKDAYAKYKDWAVVASSYNAGMGRISGELEKQHVDHSLDLWLVEETTRYVYRIIAIKQIFEHPYKYGFVLRARDLYKPVDCKEVTVSRDIMDLADYAQKQGVTYADLKRFNPWLRDRKLQTAGKSYKLLIPQEEDMYYKTPNTKVHNPAWVVGN